MDIAVSKQHILIGELARGAGVNIETVRYYERRGLLAEPERTESGYRSYAAAAANRLVFIRNAKQLGFTLREIADLLSLYDSSDTTCEQVKQRAVARLAEIAAKIKALELIKLSLQPLVDSCPSQGPLADCPIINMIIPKENCHGRQTDR